MKIEAALRALSGFMILLTLMLSHFHSPNWLWFTVFIGLNLLQSAFTGWCPAIVIFRKLGLKD